MCCTLIMPIHAHDMPDHENKELERSGLGPEACPLHAHRSPVGAYTARRKIKQTVNACTLISENQERYAKKELIIPGKNMSIRLAFENITGLLVQA